MRLTAIAIALSLAGCFAGSYNLDGATHTPATADIDRPEADVHRVAMRELVDMGHGIEHSESESGVIMTDWRGDDCVEHVIGDGGTKCRRIRWRVISREGLVQVSAQCQIRENQRAWAECAANKYPPDADDTAAHIAGRIESRAASE